MLINMMLLYPSTNKEFMFYNKMMMDRSNGWSPLGNKFKDSMAGRPLTSCEVQLTLQDFLTIKHLMHSYYNIERSTDDAFVLRKPVFMEDSCIEKTPSIVTEMRAHDDRMRRLSMTFVERTKAALRRTSSEKKVFMKKNSSSDSLLVAVDGLQNISNLLGLGSPKNSEELNVSNVRCKSCDSSVGTRGRLCGRCKTPFCKNCKKLKMLKYGNKAWQCKSCPVEVFTVVNKESSLLYTPRGIGNLSRNLNPSQLRLNVDPKSDILACGYLYKRTSSGFIMFSSPSWKGRYFTLIGTLLQYWEDEKSFRAKEKCGKFSIREAILHEEPPDTHFNSDFFYFSVISPSTKKTLHLCAPSENERKSWMSLISEAASI